MNVIIKKDNATVIFPNITKLHVMQNVTCFSITVAETANINPLMDAVKEGLIDSIGGLSDAISCLHKMIEDSQNEQ